MLDSLNGVIFEDDSQVVEGHFYVLDGEPQRTEVRVWKINEGGLNYAEHLVALAKPQ